jgi:hypothetical protein
MTRNSKILLGAVRRLGRAPLSEQALLSMLDTNCRRIGTGRTPKAARSALLLFKLGHQLFFNGSSAQAYLSDSFRLYSRVILRAHPELGGLVYLSAASDKTDFDDETVYCLRSILVQLVHRSAKVSASEIRKPNRVDDARSANPWASTLGDLSASWFSHDRTSEATFGLLDGLPHFVKS